MEIRFRPHESDLKKIERIMGHRGFQSYSEMVRSLLIQEERQVIEEQVKQKSLVA